MTNSDRIRRHDARWHTVAIPEETSMLSYDNSHDIDDGNSFEEVDNPIINHPNIPTTTKSLLLKLDSKASNIIRFDTFILKNSMDFYRSLLIDDHLHILFLKSFDQKTN